MLNKTVMMGRLTDNPELRETATGVKVCTFSVAVERDYKVNGERKADFFNIVAWRGTAELICKYFKKGKPIILEGHFENRSYIGNDGNKRYVTELIVDQVNFAGDSAKKNEPPCRNRLRSHMPDKHLLRRTLRRRQTEGILRR